MLRNRHLARPRLRALARGCQLAQEDASFARTSGSFLGGLDIDPLGIIGQVWLRSLEDVLLAWPRFFSDLSGRRGCPRRTSPRDLFDWQSALAQSLLRDPRWHFSWMRDMQRQWSNLLATAASSPRDPRVEGVLNAAD
jgi:hypothetical protein